MKQLLNIFAALCLCTVLWPNEPASAQGVTTGSLAGVVTDSQGQPVAGASVIAVHQPSGTTYEGATRPDGRFLIPGMRVGGPYSVTIAFVGTGTAFEPATQEDITVSLGVATDLQFSVKNIAVQETVTVTGQSDPVFSSSRTGAATAITRAELATLPTVSGRLGDITRLTPQASGASFAGQDSRMNNVTVDGAYFNNSFGLRNAPGDTSGVTPISLEAIEQVQVSIAPFDVRQGNFVGAGVNTVTRSGTNRLNGSFYHRFRDQDLVGKEAKGQTVNVGTFTFRNTGGWAAAPIIRNKWFAFGNFEDEIDKRPITTFRANAGNEPVTGGVTRVRADDLNRLSSFLRDNFQYDTGPYEGIPDETPANRFLIRSDYNLNNTNKVFFKYNLLDSFTDSLLSTSSSLGFGRNSGTTTNFLGYANSNYQILENIRQGTGEWNSIIGSSMSNSLLIGYTTQDESRATRYTGDLFPFVDILDGSQTYTSFGSEPFTPNNELRYKTFQLQDNFTKYSNTHSFTFGVSAERYESENIFFPGKQSAYIYNSLSDFFTDAQGYRDNPNRTTSAVTVRRFQVRYSNIPGQDVPIQPLEVWYLGAYAQDEWRPRSNLSVTAGVRFDVARFGDTGYDNPNANLLTFRDETGAAVQYESGKLPDPKILWSPRVGFNWDVASDQRTQIRGGIGVFTGKPAYVWISNQIGNTGMLTGFISEDNVTTRPFHPDPNHYKPASVTGDPPPSTNLAITDPDFKFPQLWRNNIAVDRRLPWWNMAGTLEFMYNRDVNGIYYINANLPAAQSAFTGADTRPRWVGPSCRSATIGPCATRLNNAPGNQITDAIVMKNQNVGRSWNIAASIQKPASRGLSFKGAYSYGEAKNTVDPGSIAFGTWNNNQHSADPNNPGLGYSSNSPGHRVFGAVSYSREYFSFGATTVSAYWEGRNGANTSYTFTGDVNGDGGTSNDLIYIPRDTSEMNFVTYPAGGRTYTAAEQAAAFEAYIQQDAYLRKHRGEYAERGAVFFPMVRRMDLSVMQEVFTNIGGKRNAFQVRLDILNFGNLLNSDWGVGKRLIRNQVLTDPGVDDQGRATYRLARVGSELVNQTWESSTSLGDVYSILISLRYTFN